MKVGFVGLGKLGLPCAVAIAMKGHEVMGYDLNPEAMSKEPRNYKETGPDGHSDFTPFLQTSTIQFGTLQQVCEHSEIIFLAVQTPHDRRFEGITPLTDEKSDFDYSYLVEAITNLEKTITKETIVVVISTVLPGTLRERVFDKITSKIKLCYNPFFIAMGTTMRDFLNPEFILFGGNDLNTLDRMESFYRTITDAEFYRTTVENAELIKVAYNTFIGMKVAFANTLMEICHKTPNTNVDCITKALSLGTKRLMSDRYLYGGMGDGGGCHPRDNIALSWLSEKLDLSYDWFQNVMLAREKQTEWLADLMCSYNLPKSILGYSFKAETNITTGSPALLLKNILQRRGETVKIYDPIVDGYCEDISTWKPHIFLIGSKHAIFSDYRFPKDSVVIDPWRFLKLHQYDVKLISLGVGETATPISNLINAAQMQIEKAIESVDDIRCLQNKENPGSVEKNTNITTGKTI